MRLFIPKENPGRYVLNLLKRDEIVYILKNPIDEVFVVSKSFYPDGIFRLPSGGIEDEDPKDAVAREIFEETGLSSKAPKHVATIEWCLEERGREYLSKTHIFIEEVLIDRPQISDLDAEHSAHKWVDKKHLLRIADGLNGMSGDFKGWGFVRAKTIYIAIDLI